ncbi:amidohydrolase [Cellulophaga sp. 20_2_10]|uniref:amidohydrolase n=1 Tax=Cellulophaga sp. 20_2_10 TaxID=2942476 RepID=UPI00201AE7AF|nr:amidohydrolase [Cellulophaga sp. 20_2_10]MCL5245242.1 amidohydrolase [Cellulophaga sp. 20_2_10]
MKNLTLVLLLAIAACNPKKEKVDYIVTNANVYTVDSTFTKAQAFAVKDNLFVAVGTTEEITNKYASDKTIDAGGKTITPGLIDAHCHFFGLGMNQQVVDLIDTKSFDEVVARVSAFQETNTKTFIRGRGWDQNDWEVKEFPTKETLDSLFPTIPVVLERIDGHAYIVNQYALDLANITAETVVGGGDIVQINGKLTGVLIDNPMALIDDVLPKPSIATQVQALKDAEKICVDYGLTTVDDAGLDKQTIEIIDSLQQNGEMDIRIYAMISANKENLDYYLTKGIVKTDGLNVRSVKVYGDGALGSRGAALKEEYSDKHNHYGAMVTPVAEINNLANRIAKTEYQMNTHAIGDSANVAVLRAYKSALKNTEDRRWRVEHAQIIAPQDFDYFKLGIIPSVQPTHATSDMYWAEDRLGKERVKGAYAFKKLLDIAGIVALGTDFPVERVSPFLTFYAAVARKDTKNYPENGFQKENALSREETLKGMTIWAAYSNFEEDEKGSIEAGKKADFVILSDNIMEVEEAKIPSITAEQVFIGGKQVK